MTGTYGINDVKSGVKEQKVTEPSPVHPAKLGNATCKSLTEPTLCPRGMPSFSNAPGDLVVKKAAQGLSLLIGIYSEISLASTSSLAKPDSN